MNKLIATIIFASACATTGHSLPVDSAGERAKPAFDGGAAPAGDTASAWFPALASEAALPSTARYQRELSTEQGRFELAVRVCVAPDGSVASVDLARSSGSELLDRAATKDVAAWRFESFSAPSHLRVCKPIALGYEPEAETSHLSIPLVRTSSR